MSFAEEFERRTTEKKTEEAIGKKVDAIAPVSDIVTAFKSMASYAGNMLHQVIVQEATEGGISLAQATDLATRVCAKMFPTPSDFDDLGGFFNND